MSELRLTLLGSAQLRVLERGVTLPTRKALALLAYLIMEPGPHARTTLASLLWPDSVEDSARTALRKALGFVKTALGSANFQMHLVATRDALEWHDAGGSPVDAAQLSAVAKLARGEVARDALEAVSALWRGEFMAGFSLPDAPAFEMWIDSQRDALRRDMDAVLHKLSQQQAQSGQSDAALITARARLRLDGLNEAAHRAVMTLLLELDDRAGALEAFRLCETALQRDLGIAPAAATRALAARAKTNSAGQVASLEAAPRDDNAGWFEAQPITPFVGRQREWALLEAAWGSAQVIFVGGEPGIGKSRLLAEFLDSKFSATKTKALLLENRPGDADVPYSSLARHLRTLLESSAVTLEPWVTAELSRILPELGEAPPPSELGKLRFFQAVHQTYQTAIHARDQITALFYSDAQYADAASNEAERFTLEHFDAKARTRLRLLICHRENEVSIEIKADITQRVNRGEAVSIELEPLSEHDLSVMLESSPATLTASERPEIARALRRFTGGNALFALETIKSLAESLGDHPLTVAGFEALRSTSALPRSVKVKRVIEQRFVRLSKPARDLLRVAAVMGEAYTLARAGTVLEIIEPLLWSASEELEASGVMHRNRFTHDLLYESALQGISMAARPLLHSRVLAALIGTDTSATILADHARLAEQPEDELKQRLEAGESLTRLHLHAEAELQFERARLLLRRDSTAVPPDPLEEDSPEPSVAQTFQTSLVTR